MLLIILINILVKNWVLYKRRTGELEMQNYRKTLGVKVDLDNLDRLKNNRVVIYENIKQV